MTPFDSPRYSLKKQAIALTGRFRIYDPQERLVAFVQQKAFKLKEDIRVFADEGQTQPLMTIQARNILDISAAYDVVAAGSNEKIGVLQRQGFKSLARDEWDILDANEQPLGILIEDDLTLAIVRRLIGIIPQNYDALFDGQKVADYKQRFNPFRYELDIDFTPDPAGRLDRRLGLAAAILLAAIEGRQSS